MPKTLTTERLILRPLAISDSNDLYDFYRRPKAMQFMDTPPHTSSAETEKMVGEMLDSPASTWTIRTSEDGPALGYVDFIGNEGVPGMGYILHPDHWDNGYMSEAVRAVLEHGFDELGLDRVELWIVEQNTASIRLAERVGFRRRGRLRQKNHKDESGHDKIVFGITAEQWRTGQLPGNPQAPYRLDPIMAVPDVTAAAEYYRDILGFTISFLYGDPATHAGIHCGEWTSEGAHFQLTFTDQPLPPKPLVGFYVSMGQDVDGLYDRYKAAGVHIERGPTNEPWGMREFAIRDCHGYLIRFGTPS